MEQTKYLDRYKTICEYEIENTRRKGSDYAGADDVFRNFELIEILTAGRISAAAGILVRMTDKLQRIANLLSRPAQVADESILDTLVDLSSYSKILYLYLTRHTAINLIHPGDNKPSTITPNAAPVSLDGDDPVLAGILEKFAKGITLDSADKEYVTRLKAEAEKAGV